jgi:sodium-dependent phosphate cotransporter
MEEKIKPKKLLNFLGFLFFLYLFLFSLVLIKDSFSEVGKEFLKINLDNINAINALGIGWFLTLIIQSGGAVTSALIALHTGGLIDSILLIFMVIGTKIGTTITTLLTSLLVSAKRRDFRHGFEIGLANLVYAFPIVIFMFILQYFFSFFSYAGNYAINLGVPFKINFIEKITNPLLEKISFLPLSVLIILGIFFLLFSLKKMPECMLKMWEEEQLRKKINNYMKKKYLSFFIGLFISILLVSTNIAITLLIPLVVSRMVNLKKVIPYMIGANLGGALGTVIGGMVFGRIAFPAILTFVSFGIIGLFWLLNTDLIFNMTKFISKKTIHISKKRAFFFLIFFILLALILSII